MIVVPSPDVLVAAAIQGQGTAATTQNQSGKATTFMQRVKQWIDQKRQWIQDKIDANRRHLQTMARMAWMFGQFMRAMFQFFVIIVLARMIVGFFSKPLEFIMLGISCIVLAIAYVIYFISSIPPFIYIGFIVWFFIFDILPLIVYATVMIALFILISIFCIILGLLNWATKGALKNLVLCQNPVSAWYKTPNFHMSNKYERGFFCNRQCLTGYYPDATGMYCISVPRKSPSYCPQAEVMRMYTGNDSDSKYYFKDFQTMGNMDYLTKSPEEREELLKKHYLQKRDFLEKCNKAMEPYRYMPLSLCSSIDVMDKNQISKKTVDRMKTVCSQAFCNSKVNYPFCSLLTGMGDEDDSDFWKKVMKIMILIITFMVIVTFTISYIAGVSMV